MSNELEYGKWYPISVYYENQDKLDWALVQFKETGTGFMPLPYRAEFIKRDGVWTTHSEQDRYLCELCEPIAFMLWQPCDENSRLKQIDNSSPSEALEELEKMVNLAFQVDDEFELLDDEFELHHNKVKKYILKAQEQEKVLSIIKETKNIKVSFYENGSGKHYKLEFDRTKNQTITKEEFDTLKEYLG